MKRYNDNKLQKDEKLKSKPGEKLLQDELRKSEGEQKHQQKAAQGVAEEVERERVLDLQQLHQDMWESADSLGVVLIAADQQAIEPAAVSEEA
jgi:hypothetical protein